MWLVWHRGFPDPSRPSPAIHHDDPTKDRDKSGWLAPPIPIAPEHRGMSIAELLAVDAYVLPLAARASTLGEGGAPIPANIEA